MTAETAREFAAAYKAKQMDRVMSAISFAARIGKYRTATNEDSLTEETVSILQSKGFKFNPRIAGELYSSDTISWEE